VIEDKPPATMHRPAAAEASFDSYARLLKVLMPSLHVVKVHDGFANLIWASAETDTADDASIAKEAISNALSDQAEYPAIARDLGADRSAYSFAVRGEQIELLGVVTIVVDLCGRRIAARPLQFVRQMVQPALECLRRELSLRSALVSRDRDLGVRERDFALMLEISSNKFSGSADADEFDQILKSAMQHTSCALAALWVPDKNISRTMTHSGQPMTPGVLQLAERHLLAWMQLQQRTLIVNRIAKLTTEAAAPYKILACPVRHPSERVMGVLALFNPPSAPDFDAHRARIADLLARRASEIIQAHYDPATGLMTRQALELQAQVLVATDATLGAHSILYIDIDGLHVINETFGMHVGDGVIAHVAERLRKALPATAICARISGDRFAALLPNTGLDAATAQADGVRAGAAALAPQAGGESFEVSVSIGVAPVGRSANPLAHALAAAEIACKAAKDRGRNRIETFKDADQSILKRQTDVVVVGRLRSALAEDGFRLDAQPILPLRGNYGRPRFELLLRMQGERGEILPPNKFLAAAERYQLMPAIDRWVVHRACTLLGRQNMSAGDESARFAINLSGQSLQDDGFVEYVAQEIHDSRTPPAVLCFELTETATVGNLKKAQLFIQRLQALGCQFALDDFGTGVSSLAYLKDLSVDYLKIDGSFVRDAIDNPRSESMIKAIAQLAKVMCIETIAEHVETDALRARMADLGVDYGQGFAIGKAQRFEDLLQELAIYEASVSAWAAPQDAGAANS